MRFVKRIIKKIKKNSFLSFLSRMLIYSILRLLFFTYRLDVSYKNKNVIPLDQQSGIFYFWHQQIIAGMFFFFKNRAQGACIASPSSDGKIAGYICQKLGFNVLYGSSHKASISVLRRSLMELSAKGRLCLVGDGSRGPAFKLQSGVTALASKANAPLVFVECHVSSALTFKKSWDQFKVPLPFSKISITVHEPAFQQEQLPQEEAPEPAWQQACAATRAIVCSKRAQGV